MLVDFIGQREITHANPTITVGNVLEYFSMNMELLMGYFLGVGQKITTGDFLHNDTQTGTSYTAPRNLLRWCCFKNHESLALRHCILYQN